MKTFHTVEIVKAPVDAVWHTVVDRLDDLVPQLDDVKSVSVRHREELPDGSVRLINLWRGKANIPAVLNSVIKPELLTWTDHAFWNRATRQCDWRIELHFDVERTRCHGLTKFEPALGGRGARVTFSGEFAMNAKGMRGVPVVLESTVERGVEAFVASLIPGNFRKLVQAAGSLLASPVPPDASNSGLSR